MGIAGPIQESCKKALLGSDGQLVGVFLLLCFIILQETLLCYILISIP